MHSSKQEQLNALYKPYANCQQCLLAKLGRAQVVFGEGNPDAPLLIVGAGPGKDEDRLGRPFIGRSGQLLRKTLDAVGISPDQCYITNVVKCRPPENRLPSSTEMKLCASILLDKQIEIIQPKVICTLGSCATRAVLQVKQVKMGQIRTQNITKNGRRVTPTFHPAYILRNAKMRDTWILDLKRISLLAKIA